MTRSRWPGATNILGATALSLFLLLLAVALVLPISGWIESKLDRTVELDRWQPIATDSACTVAGVAAPLLTLRCGTDPAPIGALLAGGMPRSVNELSAALAAVTADTALGPRFRCSLVKVAERETAGPAAVTVPYARCTVGGQDLSLLLIAASILQPPISGSPAWTALGPQEQATLRSLAPPTGGLDPARASRVAIQAWIATLLGLLAAGVGFFYSVLARANREKRTGRQLSAQVDLELSSLDQLLNQESARQPAVMGKSWSASPELLRRVARVVRAMTRWVAHHQAAECMPLVTDLERSTEESPGAVDGALDRLRGGYRKVRGQS